MQSLIEKIKQRIRFFLLSHNIKIGWTSGRPQLEGFFNGVRPVATDRALICLGGDSDG
jgi:hypothetical protein